MGTHTVYIIIFLLRKCIWSLAWNRLELHWGRAGYVNPSCHLAMRISNFLLMIISLVPMTLGKDSSRMKSKAGNGASSNGGYMIQHAFGCKQETTQLE